jgi:hypothetical protein
MRPHLTRVNLREAAEFWSLRRPRHRILVSCQGFLCIGLAMRFHRSILVVACRMHQAFVTVRREWVPRCRHHLMCTRSVWKWNPSGHSRGANVQQMTAETPGSRAGSFGGTYCTLAFG